MHVCTLSNEYIPGVVVGLVSVIDGEPALAVFTAYILTV